jgi:signal transduction histidine kinase
MRTDMGDYFGFLREIYFFRDLDDDEVRFVESFCKEEQFAEGEVVFGEGSTGEKFYIVLSGTVEVWKDFAGENPDRIATHGKGYLFGEMALVDNMPRSATVTAGSDVRLLYLTRDEFQEVLGKSSNIAISVIRSISAMVRKSNQSFLDSLHRRNRELEEANQELRETQQELLEAERLTNIGKFSSMILHDIRNPISVIKSYGEMIRLHNDDPGRVEKYTSNILRETDRLGQFANELLDYSRGEVRLDLRITNLDSLLDRVRSEIESRFGSRNIELSIECSYHEAVILDEERLVRVFLNLAENARKAMPNGGTLTIEARQEGDHILFRVSDTGEGMRREVVERIFEPFYSSSKTGGTGLGLVIVKNVVEAHDGALDVTSTPRQGSTFEIRLPLKG